MAVSAWLWGFTPAASSRCCTARRRREVRRPGAAPQQCPPRPARPAQSRHRSRLACEVLGVALMACSRRLLCLPAQEACCSDRMGAALPAPHLQRHAGAPPAEVAVGTLLRQWRCGLALEARGASLHSTARVPSASDGNGAPWQATGWWPSTVRGTRHLLTGASCTTQFREDPPAAFATTRTCQGRLDTWLHHSSCRTSCRPPAARLQGRSPWEVEPCRLE